LAPLNKPENDPVRLLYEKLETTRLGEFLNMIGIDSKIFTLLAETVTTEEELASSEGKAKEQG